MPEPGESDRRGSGNSCHPRHPDLIVPRATDGMLDHTAREKRSEERTRKIMELFDRFADDKDGEFDHDAQIELYRLSIQGIHDDMDLLRYVIDILARDPAKNADRIVAFSNTLDGKHQRHEILLGYLRKAEANRRKQRRRFRSPGTEDSD